MSFVSSAFYNESVQSTDWLPAWEKAYNEHDGELASRLFQRVSGSAREVLCALSSWVEAEPNDAPSRRHFYNIAMGVHPEDQTAHEALSPLLAAVQRGMCTLQPMPGASPGVWLVLDIEDQAIGVFKAGERRAFMEILARKVAFVLGLEQWVVPGTIAAITEVNVPVPPFDRERGEQLASPSDARRLTSWEKADPRFRVTGGRVLGMETLGWQRKVIHPDLEPIAPAGQPPIREGVTTGALVGILEPFLRDDSRTMSPAAYDSAFVGLTATAIALGLSQGNSRGIVANTWVDLKTLMPAYLEHPGASLGDQLAQVPASCGLAYQAMACAGPILHAQYVATGKVDEGERGRRLAAVPPALGAAVAQWPESMDRVLQILQTAAPVLVDAAAEAPVQMSAATGARLMRDANGALFHLEPMEPDPLLHPVMKMSRAGHQVRSLFSRDQQESFLERMVELETVLGDFLPEDAQQWPYKKLQPLQLLAAVDPIARAEIEAELAEEADQAVCDFLEDPATLMMSQEEMMSLLQTAMGADLRWLAELEAAQAKGQRDPDAIDDQELRGPTTEEQLEALGLVQTPSGQRKGPYAICGRVSAEREQSGGSAIGTPDLGIGSPDPLIQGLLQGLKKPEPVILPLARAPAAPLPPEGRMEAHFRVSGSARGLFREHARTSSGSSSHSGDLPTSLNS